MALDLTALIARVARLGRAGLLMASVLSCLPAIAALVSGSLTLRLRGGESVGLFSVIAVYIGGGIVGGGLVGALLPLVRWRAGAAAVGIVAAVPVMAGAAYSLSRFAPPFDWITVAIASVALGGLVGVAYRAMFWDDIVRELGTPPDKSSRN